MCLTFHFESFVYATVGFEICEVEMILYTIYFCYYRTNLQIVRDDKETDKQRTFHWTQWK